MHPTMNALCLMSFTVELLSLSQCLAAAHLSVCGEANDAPVFSIPVMEQAIHTYCTQSTATSSPQRGTTTHTCI